MIALDTERTLILSEDASHVAVRRLLANLRDRLGIWRIPQETCGTVELVLAEALNNIVEHAYGAQEPGPITVQVVLRAEKLDVTLTDTGKPLPPHALPPGNLPDTSGPLETLPEGGFGWFLICHLTEALRYARHQGQNQLSFEIPV